MKVFSKEKYLKWHLKMYGHTNCAHWPDECDGMPVKDERCKGRNGITYGTPDVWCINVPETVNCRCAIVKEENTMYTMKDFINEPIAVRVGQDHALEFLKMCEAEGLKWRHGEKPTRYVPDVFGDKMCITRHCKFGHGDLMVGDVKCYEEQHLTIVDFKDIKPNEPRYQIIIDCDGKTTTAKMLVDGKEVKTGVAKYNPADKFDFSIGAKVAFDRLWGKEPAKEPEPVKKFKVGDRVKCVRVPDGNKDVVGKCGVVKGEETDGDLLVEFDEAHKMGHAGYAPFTCKPDHGWWCYPSTLKLVKDEPFPFKVGDRVKCIMGFDGKGAIVGKYGTVIHVMPNTGLPVTVEFDDDIDGHAGLGRVSGKPGHCWWCPVRILELVTVREVKRPAKPGEYIKIVSGADTTHDEYKIGDILKVVKVDDALLPGDDEPHVAFYKNELCKYANYDEYVVLEGYREVKRHAKVGEWVKIVNAKGHSAEQYKNGDILKVTADAFGGVGVRFTCGGCHCVDSEYVVLEGYKG